MLTKSISQSFQLLRQIYPNKRVVDLWDLFEKCNLAIDILLRDNLYGNQLYDSDSQSNETFNCNCDNNTDYTCIAVDPGTQQNVDVDIKENSALSDNINKSSIPSSPITIKQPPKLIKLKLKI